MSTFKFFAKSKKGKADKPLWTRTRQWWRDPYQLTRLNFSCGSLWTCMCTHWSQCHCAKHLLYEALLPFFILLTMKSAQVQHRETAAPFQIHLLLDGRSGRLLWPVAEWATPSTSSLVCLLCLVTASLAFHNFNLVRLAWDTMALTALHGGYKAGTSYIQSHTPRTSDSNPCFPQKQ